MSQAVKGILIAMALSVTVSSGVWAATRSPGATSITWIVTSFGSIPFIDRAMNPGETWIRREDEEDDFPL